MSDTPREVDLLEQTLYLARKIYDDPNVPPTPLDLHSACAIGSYDCVYDAITAGKDINKRNKSGWTPLMYAAYVGHDTVVNLLLESGADPSKGTGVGLTPLMVAAGCGNESVCYFLLQSGAEMDVQDSDGYTALGLAVRQGHQNVVQLLLEAGANLEIAEYSHGQTGLMMAAVEGDEIIVDILLACGADLYSKDNDGHTARSLALANNHVRTVTLLDNALYLEQCDQGTEVGQADTDGGEGEDEERTRRDSSELFIGAREMEVYQQTRAVRKALQFNLSRRGSSLQWSLPEEALTRRGSAPPLAALKRKILRTAMSMPEQSNPPGFMEELAVLEEEEVDSKLAEFLKDLGLEKYLQLFQRQEIDLESLMGFSDEDLKRVGLRLLGPRKKLLLGLVELRERKEGEKRGGGGRGGAKPSKKASRPHLMKQPSTELTAAYQQAVETIEQLQHQLAQEHQLRATTDSYLLELQQARQQATSCVAEVKEGHKSIRKHCNSVRSTHSRLNDEVECLRLLSSSSIMDPSQLHRIYSEVVSLTSRMRLELEALSRSVEGTQQQVDTLAFHLTSTSSSSRN